MNAVTHFVVRALSLVATVGITALIIFVHDVDFATPAPRDVTASGVIAIAPMKTTGAQLAARRTCWQPIWLTSSLYSAAADIPRSYQGRWVQQPKPTHGTSR